MSPSASSDPKAAGRPRRRLVAALASAAVVATMLASPGCKDKAAADRVAAKQLIDEMSLELHIATLSPVAAGDESAPETRDKLENVISRLENGLRGADKGMQAAGSLLVSTAHQHLAALSLAEADAIEAANRHACAVLHGEIDAAMRLDAAASGRETYDTSDERRTLANMRSGAQSSLRDFSQRMAALDGPISEREQANTVDSREAMRLAEEAGHLRRRAQELGPADGLSTVMEALDLEARADHHRTDIAGREIELQYQYRPEHRLFETLADTTRGHLSELSKAEEALDQRDSIEGREVATTRQLIGRYRTRIDEAISALESASTTALANHYEDAREHLERAVSEATSAARNSERDASDAANLSAARASTEKARLHAMQARGYAMQASVLERLASSGGALGDVSAYRSALEAVANGERDAIEKANEAFEAARQHLGNVRGRASRTEVEAFKASIDLGAAALSGEAVDLAGAGGGMPGAVPRAPSMPTPGGAPPSLPSQGYPSAQDLVDAINGIDATDLRGMDRVLAAVHAESDQLRQMLALERDVIRATAEFSEAVTSKFSEADAAMFTSMLQGQMAGDMISSAELTDASDTTASVAYSSPDEPNGTLELVVVDGQWFITAESKYAGEDRMAMEMALAMMPMMTQAMRDIAQRINAGEITNPTELQQAFEGVGGGMPAGGP